MATTGIDAELFQSLSLIADNETYKEKVVNYIKKLVSPKKQEEERKSISQERINLLLTEEKFI